MVCATQDTSLVMWDFVMWDLSCGILSCGIPAQVGSTQPADHREKLVMQLVGWLVGWLVGALSPVNHWGLCWKQPSVYLPVIR